MGSSETTANTELMNAYKANMRLHKRLLGYIGRQMTSFDRRSFVNIIRGLYLPPATTDRFKDDTYGLLEALETVGDVRIGEYTTLCTILTDAHLVKLSEEVAEMGKCITCQPEAELLENIENGNVFSLPDIGGDCHCFREHKHEKLQDASESWQTTCREKESLLVRTRSYNESLRTLKKNRTVLILANSGDGKTFILRQLSLEMAREGFLTVLLQSPSEIKDKFLKGRKLLFLFDDPFGGAYLIPSTMEDWVRFNRLYFENILNSGMVLLVFSCNKLIWSDCKVQLENIPVFQNVVDASSENLTYNEKREMLTKHLADKNLSLSNNAIKQVCMSETIAFPQCCDLMSGSDNDTADEEIIVNDFLHPCGYLRKQLRLMLTTSSGRWKYAVLVLIMLNGGHLFPSLLNLNIKDRTMTMLSTVVRTCCRSNDIDIGAVWVCAKSLAESYLRVSLVNGEARYEFKNDSILEAVALEFGQTNSEYILEYCDPAFCLNICRQVEYDNPRDSRVIRVFKKHYDKFVKILTNQVLEKRNWSVFSHPAVEDVTIQKSLIDYMKTIDMDVLENDDSGMILYYAAKSGANELIRFLIERGAKCSHLLRFHPFVAFAAGGHIDIVTKFLNTNKIKLPSSINENEDNTAHCLITHEDASPTKQLILDLRKCSYDLSRPSVFVEVHRHALMQASCERQTGMLRLLLDHVDRNHSSFIVGEALECAAIVGHADVVKMLRNENVSKHSFGLALAKASGKGHMNVVRILLQMNQSCESIRSALIECSQMDQIDIVQMLLRYNVTTAAVGEALIVASVWQRTDVVGLHLSHGVSREALLAALHEASWRGYADVVKQLLRYDIPTADLGQLLGEAASWGRENMVRLFVKFRISSDSLAKALSQASGQGQISVVKIVLKVNPSTEALGMAILEALKHNQVDIAELLLKEKIPGWALDNAIVIASGKGLMGFVSLTLNKFSIRKEFLDEAANEALKCGYLDLVQLLLQHGPSTAALSDILREASFCGYTKIVAAVLKFNLPRKAIGESLIQACAMDSLDIVVLLLQKESSECWLCKALNEAAMFRRINVLRCFLELIIPSAELTRTMSEVARRGFQEVVQLFLDYDPPKKAINQSLIEATWGGQSVIVKMLLAKNPSRRTMGQALGEASRRNQHELVQILIEKNIPKSFIHKSMLEATWMGHLPVLETLHQRTSLLGGYDLSSRLITAATNRGHIGIVRHLLEKGVPPNTLSSVLTDVLQSGDYYLLETFIAHNPPVESIGAILDIASWEGNYKVVELLVQHDIPPLYLKEALCNASSRGHAAIAELLLKQCEVLLAYAGDALVNGSRRGHSEIAKVLLGFSHHANTLGKALIDASANGHVDLVLLLLNYSPKAEEVGKALLRAAWMGHTYILQQLMPGLPENILGKALTYAVWRGQILCVKILLQNALPLDMLAEAAVFASWRGHRTIVQLLMECNLPEKTLSQTLHHMSSHRPIIHLDFKLE